MDEERKEIKIGDYARSKQGYIAKVTDITKEYYEFDNTIKKDQEETEIIPLEEFDDIITNYSDNIIDLIERGDYINGFIVRAKDTKNIYFDYLKKCSPYQIKSIVTKERFKQIEMMFYEEKTLISKYEYDDLIKDLEKFDKIKELRPFVEGIESTLNSLIIWL